MKKFKRIITLLLMTLLLTNCGKEKLSLNEEVTLKGRITHQEVTENNSTKKISVLTLDEPIVIDGDLVRKIELEYDKDLKTDTDVTISGKIKNNSGSTYDYLFSASDIDDILSYVNTFSNDDFSITIPTDLIKEVIVNRIDNGFAIYLEHKDIKYEVFKAIAVTNDEYQNIKESNEIEVATKKDNKRVLIVYSEEETPDELSDTVEKIYKSIPKIKGNIRMK